MLPEAHPRLRASGAQSLTATLPCCIAAVLAAAASMLLPPPPPVPPPPPPMLMLTCLSPPPTLAGALHVSGPGRDCQRHLRVR